MKLRKLMAAAAAVLITITSCSMLTLGAGAYSGVTYNELKGQDLITGDPIELATAITNTTDSLSFTPAVNDNSGNTLIPSAAINAARDKITDTRTFTFSISDTQNSKDITYTAVMNKAFQSSIYDASPALVAGSGINLAVDFTFPETGILKINGTSYAGAAASKFGGLSLSYTVEYSDAMELLTRAGISNTDMLRFYTKDASGQQTTLKITKAAANLTFDISDHDDPANNIYNTYDGLYITAYNPKQEEYYTKDESDDLVREALIDTFGLEDADSLTLDQVTAAINAELQGNYISKNNVYDAIHDYFTTSSTDSLGNTVTAPEKIRELTGLILADNGSKEMILNSVFDAFGDDTTQRQAEAIRDYVIDTVETDVANQISALLTPAGSYTPAQLGTAIQNLIGQELSASTLAADLAALKNEIDAAKAANSNKSVKDILEDIKAGITQNSDDISKINDDINDINTNLGTKTDQDQVNTLIQDALKDAIGDIDYTDSTVQAYIDTATADIRTLLAGKADAATISTYVTNYLNDNIDDLIKNYMVGQRIDENVVKSILLDMLGEDSNYLSSKELNQLNDDLFNKIVDKAAYIANVSKTADDRYNNIAELLRTFITDEWIRDAVKDLQYVDENTVDEKIRTALNQYTGYQDYVDAASKAITDKLDDFATETEVNEAIKNYLSKKENVSSFIDEYLKDMNLTQNITDTVAAAFDDMTAKQREKISDYMWDEISDKIADEAVNAVLGSDLANVYLTNKIRETYYNNIDYWTNSLQSQINSLVSDVRNNSERIDALLRSLNNGTYNGTNGTDGQSFSDWAVQRYGSIDGFISAIANQVARQVQSGASAYEIAVQNGYRGTQQDWLNSLVGDSAYDIAVKNGYRGSEKDWLESLQGADGKDGKDGRDGRDGADGQIVYVNGYAPNSASPTSGGLDYTDPDDAEEDEVYVLDDTNEASDSATGLIDKRNSANADAAAMAAAGNARSANPATGAAAGIIIPAAAIGSVLFIKKDKRKRGRK